ncbi:MAG: metallophosphoesterase family protein [Verrucomicrobia bacterium]|nr:metallophosphoesterase family protein [Verrucomicrobiota bacterium]
MRPSIINRIPLASAAKRGLAAWILLGSIQTQAAVLIGPFLEGVTTTNAYVLAECDSTATITTAYGVDTNYGAIATTAFTKSTGKEPYVVHRIKLTGLKPNTLYHYQLTGQGFTSPDYAFRTLANPGTSFRFAWQADFRNGTAVHNAIAGRILTNAQPLFVLEGGDVCDSADWAKWHRQYFLAGEKELGKWIPIYPSPGNHEGWGPLTQAYYQSPDSTGTNGYYSFDCGDAHFVMANYLTDHSRGSAQYKWIQEDLQSSLKPWKIFGTHSPAYCAGGHGEDAKFKIITTNILEPNAVSVFLGGHSHFYQHNLVNGIHHLVVGAAGAPIGAPSNRWYTVRSAQSNCYLVGDVSATNLHMVVYDDIGAVLETIDLSKLPAPASSK